MALSIKTDEADALARALSERTGETLTAAVTTALRERLNRVSAQNPRRYLDGIDNLAEDFRRHATSVMELGIVVESRTGGRTPVERVLQRFELSVEPLDQAEYMTAMEAWRRFGKGNHPAQLNPGDCYSYALAAVRGVPLLFVGSDFTQTDIIAA